jgi:hypothetical protein
VGVYGIYMHYIGLFCSFPDIKYFDNSFVLFFFALQGLDTFQKENNMSIQRRANFKKGKGFGAAKED